MFMNRVFHVLLVCICSLNTVIHVRSFGLLQKLFELVHHVGFMLHQGVSVAVQSDRRIFVPENLGQCFHVHSTFEGAGSKRMPQGVKSFVRYTQFYKEQFESTLIGTDENGLAV